MPDESGSPRAAAVSRAAVADLRQYTLVPGRREELIELFDEHLVDGQEAVGMHVIGQFRDLDDPDRFVWLRGFDSWAARGAALPAFYYGPVWTEHCELANATMVDSDDALLLRPVYLGAGYPRFGAGRDLSSPASLIGVTVLYRSEPIDDSAVDVLVGAAVRELAEAGGDPIAVFVTDPSPNNFPALPLRAENVVVWINRFDSDERYRDHLDRLAASRRWREDVLPPLAGEARLPMQQLRLRPTRRSQLR